MAKTFIKVPLSGHQHVKSDITDLADATTSVSGLMSGADKSKLNGIAANANNYAHPTGDGNLHVPVTGTSNNGKVLMAGATAGSASWQTLPNATTSANGLMSSTDKSKLDGIAANANNYSHPGGDGNLHVPVTGTSNNGKVLMAGSTAGSLSWGMIPDATPSVSGLMSGADKTKLNGIATGANNYSHPTGDGNLHVPANGTGNNGRFLMATGTAGSYSWSQMEIAHINGLSGSLANKLNKAGDTMTGALNMNKNALQKFALECFTTSLPTVGEFSDGSMILMRPNATSPYELYVLIDDGQSGT